MCTQPACFAQDHAPGDAAEPVSEGLLAVAPKLLDGAESPEESLLHHVLDLDSSPKAGSEPSGDQGPDGFRVLKAEPVERPTFTTLCSRDEVQFVLPGVHDPHSHINRGAGTQEILREILRD